MHARIRASIAGIESRGRKTTRRNLMDHTGRYVTAIIEGFRGDSARCLVSLSAQVWVSHDS